MCLTKKVRKELTRLLKQMDDLEAKYNPQKKGLRRYVSMLRDDIQKYEDLEA